MRFAATLFILCCLPLQAAEQIDYTVGKKMPQARDNFVQGLEVDGNSLLLSSGGYGESKLRRYDLASGDLLYEYELPKKLFAEGLTRWQDRLYQLTWRAGRVLVYDAESLRPQRSFRIPGEGWGITHNDTALIYSDGSDKLFFIDPASEKITHSIAVRMQGKPVTRLNELEWIDGRVWANVWMTDRIIIINPHSGEVESYLDLNGLLAWSDRRLNTDVLNGIAYNPANGDIWVTGKRWPWRYQIIPQRTKSP